MKRLHAAIKYDIIFQFRQGFYLAYGFVTLVYFVFLKLIPSEIAKMIFPFLLFTDISVLGFFLIGGVLLLEKNQNTLDALFVTPLTVVEYLLSKVISLTIIATLATVVLYVAVSRDLNFLPILLLIVWANMFLYTLFGIGLTSRIKNVNEYFIMGVPIGIILFLPLLTYFDIIKFDILYLLPTQPTLEMLNGNISISAVLIVMVWIIISWITGYSFFIKYVVRKGA